VPWSELPEPVAVSVLVVVVVLLVESDWLVVC
jgi:hypothetical protein